MAVRVMVFNVKYSTFVVQESTLVDWDDVRVFLAVARAGQLLAAGQALQINHATVARRMAALERALGSTLLVRRTNGSGLSPAGERFLEFAERMEREMLEAREAVGAGDISVAGSVRIGAPDGFGIGFLASRLAPLIARYPDLRIDLVPISRAFSLSRRDVDIAIMMERPVVGQLVARKLVDFTLGLYASPAYLGRHGRPNKTDDLLAHQLVGYVEDLIFSPALDYTSEVLRGWRSHLGISSAMGQMEAVRSGAGIGILHNFAARGDSRLERILPEMCIARSYWLAIHEHLQDLRRVKLASDYLSQLVSEERNLFA